MTQKVSFTLLENINSTSVTHDDHHMTIIIYILVKAIGLNTQHNETQHNVNNDTQHNNKNAAISIMALENDVMVIVAKMNIGEYRYAECSGAAVAASTIKMFRNLQIDPISWTVTLHKARKAYHGQTF
jgi:hypothetical protein